MENPKYKRVLLKLSGEALMGDANYGISPDFVEQIAQEIAEIRRTGIDLCLVVGGGNIFRGVSGAASGMDRAPADYMGMLATIMNAIALKNSLERVGVQTRVQSAIPMQAVSEPFIRDKALTHLSKGRVVIFAAGTGNPYFTTDTAAALRAAEMSCDVLIKATKVDGIYDADPVHNPDAQRYDCLTFQEVLAKELKVMDATAIALANGSRIPIMVTSLKEPGMLLKAVQGEGRYTLVTPS